MTILPSPVSAGRASDALSPLMLSHQLLSLADDAHRAGLSRSASRLLRLALSVCNEGPRT